MGLDINNSLIIGYPLHKFVTEEFKLCDVTVYNRITGEPETIQENTVCITFNDKTYEMEDRYENLSFVADLISKFFGESVCCYFTGNSSDCGSIGLPITKINYDSGGRFCYSYSATEDEVLNKFKEAYTIFKDVDEKPKLMIGVSASY
jgi:hypothetical protein